jgi:hypothetical protein
LVVEGLDKIPCSLVLEKVSGKLVFDVGSFEVCRVESLGILNQEVDYVGSERLN